MSYHYHTHASRWPTMLWARFNIMLISESCASVRPTPSTYSCYCTLCAQIQQKLFHRCCLGCSSPICSLVPCMAGKSGPQQMLFLSRCWALDMRWHAMYVMSQKEFQSALAPMARGALLQTGQLLECASPIATGQLELT